MRGFKPEGSVLMLLVEDVKNAAEMD